MLSHIFQVADFWAYQYISFAIQKILNEMSPTWLSIFLHILPKFRDFALKLLFWGIFKNISSILLQICPFLTVFGEYFPTNKIFTKIWDIPKFSQKNYNYENLGEKLKKKILEDNTDFSLTIRFYLIFRQKWTLNYLIRQ